MFKILIVDDERMIREGIKKVICWEQLDIEQVFTASTGQEALEIVGKKKPEIMITDINMSGMSGLELIEAVRKAAPEMRILALTGYDRFDYARDCLRLHVQDFLLKPIDEEVLHACILKEVNFLKEEGKKEEQKWQKKAINIAEQLELESHIRNLLHGKNKEKAMGFIHEHYPDLEQKDLTVVILMPQLFLDYAQQENLLHMQQIRNTCLGVLDSEGLGITLLDAEDGQIIILSFENLSGADGGELLSGLQEIIEDEVGYSPKLIIGNQVSGIEYIHTSYLDALCLLQNESKDYRSVLQTQSAINRREMFHEVYEELKNQMCANIIDEAYVMRAFDSFCAAVDAYGLAVGSVRKCCFELISSIYFTCVQAGNGVEQDLMKFLQSINSSDAEECKELSRVFLAKMVGLEKQDVHDIVSKAKRYINSHLEEELSVSEIAKMLYVSPNYFSRLFKRVTGQGCNEYIVCKRIEKACVLLENTNLNTGKIAGMVGYNDTNYFSMAFKKHCGVSPTHYRNNLRNGKE